MKIINETIVAELIQIAENNREELEEHFCIPVRQWLKTDFDGEKITTICIEMKREFAFLGEEDESNISD